jgi:hypothetical protein
MNFNNQKMKERLHYTRGYCPIPREQRVFLSYIRLRNNKLSKFILFEQKQIILFNILNFLSCYSISNFLFYFNSYKNIHFLDFSNRNLIFPILLFNILNFLVLKDWEQLKFTIQDSITVYEESGMLEGRLWKKPIVTLIQDQLILSYRIKPAIKKIIFQTFFYNFLIISFLIPFSLFK